MQSPLPSTATTYTTIPISAEGVITRSIHNLTNTISRHRPWSEFASTDVFDRPDSIPSALARARTNFSYFRINYSFLVAAAGAFSLIGNPSSLLFISAIFALWLLFYFFREDPFIIMDRHVSNRIVLVSLVIASLLGLWLTGCFQILVIGVIAGVIVCAVHAAFRNPNGLFLEEDEAVSSGLIGSGSVTGSLPTQNHKR